MPNSASQSDPAEADAEHPLVLPARIERGERYKPGWASLVSPLQTFVGLLPSHKNTRKGRRAARHLKILAGGIGFGMVVFAQDLVATFLGVLFLALAPWLPLPQVRKRAWLNSLKKLREPRRRIVETDARVTFDGRRVVLQRDGTNLRRVLTDRDEHQTAVGTVDDRLYLKLAPDSGRKSETLWIGTDELGPEDVPDDWELESFSTDAIDAPTLIGASDWRTLSRYFR